MQTIPEAILQYLQKNPAASTSELCRHLTITRPGLHHHLNRMVKANQIERIENADIRNKGRPAYTYRLCSSQRPSNNLNLCKALLRHFESQSTISFTLLASLLFPDAPHSPNFLSTIKTAISMLNEHHYRARWEAHQSGPMVFFHQCPYSELILEHPQLCKMDAAILRQLTGIEFIKVRDDHKTPLPPCVFIQSSDKK